MEVNTIGLDLAKTVFKAHGADASGAVVLRKQLRRNRLLEFFARQSPCIVAMEACGGAHYWAREIGNLGHKVRLIAGHHLYEGHAAPPGPQTPHRKAPPAKHACCRLPARLPRPDTSNRSG